MEGLQDTDRDVNKDRSSLLQKEQGKEMAIQHGSDDFKLRFGWRKFRPNYLQRFNKPVYFLVCLCALVFGQGLVCTGIANTTITSVEKRYGFTSTHVGLFKTCFHISAGLFNVVVCYIGHRHRPLTLGVGCVFIALGNFIVTISHYISPPYQAGVTLVTDVCRWNNNTTSSTASQCAQQLIDDQGKHTAIFIIGYCIIGLGVTPIYGLAFAHLDDITPRGKNSLYMGMMGLVGGLGPAAGFFIANPLLKVFVDICQPANSSLTPADYNWVGAWWVGYLVGAAILLLPIIPMLGFPSRFPNNEKLKEAKSKLEDTIAENKSLRHDLSSIWPATKILLTNIPYLLSNLANSSESLSYGGFSLFLPKYIETQFHVTAAEAAVYSGVILIVGISIGVFLGGYLMKRFQWNCKQTLQKVSALTFLSFLFTFALLVGCEGRDLVGIDIPYHNSSSPLHLVSECNRNCQCSTRFYKPVCSPEHHSTFFSACHAGCSTDQQKLKFFNCSCLPPDASNHVVTGSCKTDCKLFPVFSVLISVQSLLSFICLVPMLNIMLRTVPEGQGSFAMGFQQLFSRFLGFIPAPALFGWLIDGSCKLWHKDECSEETTSCLEYQNAMFKYRLFGIAAFTKLLTFIFLFSAYKIYRLPEKKHEDTIGDKNNENGEAMAMTERT